MSILEGCLLLPEIAEKLRARGIFLDTLIADQKWHRFHWLSDKKKHGSYKVIETGFGVQYIFTHFKNRTLGFSFTTAKTNLTKEQLEEHHLKIKEADELQRKKQEKKWELARLQCEHMWSISIEEPHPYLEKKRIKSHGSRVNPYKNLLIPARDINGALQGIQLIQPNSKKENIENSRLKGNFHAIASIDPSGTLYICEGFATAAALFEATQRLSVCAFGAHSFLECGKNLLKRYPAIQLVFSGDSDPNGVGLKESKKAAQILKQNYLIPKFRSPGSGTDWNDLRNIEGDKAVIEQIIQFETKKEFPAEDFVLKSLEDLDVSLDLNGSLTLGKLSVSIQEIASSIRVRAARLNESVKRGFIEDYLSEWHREKTYELRSTFISQFFNKEKHDKELSLLKTFMKAFLRRDDELAVTAILHFIWQVKRKMKGMPVSHHMMPVFCGATGKGKSVALRERFLAPLKSLAGSSTLNIFGDDRLWGYFENHYAVFFDEMAKSRKESGDMLKFAITADEFDIAPKYLGLRKAKQNATFIGASNLTIESIIQDETSNRRFFPIDATEDTDRGTINSIDYLTLWQSVDETMPCPVISVLDSIKATQESNRNKSNVEMFLERYGFERTDREPGPERWGIAVTELLKLYELWRRENGFEYGLNSKTLSSELKRLRVAKFESNSLTGHFLYARIPLGLSVGPIEFLRTGAKVVQSGENGHSSGKK